MYLKEKQTEMEYYLSHHNFEIRKSLTEFRTIKHSLPIEVGRYKKTTRDHRFCPSCKDKLDNEYHLFLH